MHEELNKINKMLFDKIQKISTENEEIESMRGLLEDTLNSWGAEIFNCFSKNDNYDHVEPKFRVEIDKEAIPPLQIVGDNDAANEIIKLAKEMKLTDLL